MKSFARLAVGFLLVGLVILAFALILGPPSYRGALRAPTHPVGQLESNAELKSPGQPEVEGTRSPSSTE